MKKLMVLFGIIILVVIVSLLRARKEDDYLVKINNYVITRQEFNSEFKDSAYAKHDTLESRKEFLRTLIKRKLILQDAQRKGLDKDQEFLKTIERFWEQSLLKRAIDQKVQELSGSVSVTDQAIEEAYKKIQKDGKADKPYDQMYNQIKWSLSRLEESQALDRWIKQLSKSALIKVNSSDMGENVSKDNKKRFNQ